MKLITELYATNTEQAFEQIKKLILQNPQDENHVLELIAAEDYYLNWNKNIQKEFYTLLNIARTNLKLNDSSVYWDLLLFWEKYALEEMDVLALLSVYFNFIKTNPNKEFAVFYYLDKCASFQTYPDLDFIELGLNKLTNDKSRSLTWIKLIKTELEVDVGKNGRSIKQRWPKIIEYANNAANNEKEIALQNLKAVFEDYRESGLDEEIDLLLMTIN